MSHRVEIADDVFTVEIEHDSDALHRTQAGRVAMMVERIVALDSIKPVSEMRWEVMIAPRFDLHIQCTDGCSWDAEYVVNGPNYTVYNAAVNGWTIREIELIQDIRAFAAILSQENAATLIRFVRL